jgi:hypothetical protein
MSAGRYWIRLAGATFDDDVLRSAFGAQPCPLLLLGHIYPEEHVHGFCSGGQDRSQLSRVDHFGCPRA